MTTLLFKLAQVPDDEAQDIRDLLTLNGIHFYETDAGFWRVGVDAIWLSDKSQLDEARALISSYQNERTAQQKQHYAELIEQGEAQGIWQRWRARPFRFIGFVLAILFVLGITLVPFVMLMF